MASSSRAPPSGAALGVVLARIGEMSSTWAGVMALIAAAAVMWCVVHMMHAGKGISKAITDRLAEIAALQGPQAWWSVFAFTVFMISREGVEARDPGQEGENAFGLFGGAVADDATRAGVVAGEHDGADVFVSVELAKGGG